MKRRKIVALMIVMSMALATATSGCGEKSDASENTEVASLLKVSVVSPVVTDINVDGEYIGTFAYNNEVAVFPLLSGEVTNTYFEEGDYVEAGMVLFTLDDEAYQLSLDNAQAAYNSAQIGVESQLSQLQMGRDSALNSLATAQEGVSQIEDSINYYNDQISDMRDQRVDIVIDQSELSDDKDDMKKDLEQAEKDLEDAINAYKDAAMAYQQAEAAKIAQDTAAAAGVSGNAAGGMIITDSYLAGLKEAMQAASSAVAAAQQKVATYQSAVETMRSGITSYDNALDQIDSSIESIEYQIENMDYSYTQAVRGVQLAQENLDYYDNYTIPTAEASANASLTQARLGIDSAELQLSYTIVTAPVSGTIMTKSVDVHDMAQAGYPAYVLVDEDSMIISFGVPESTARAFVVGQTVSIEKDGQEYSGKIAEISSSVDQYTGLFTVKASVSGDTAALISGTKATVSATTASVSGVITMPIDCVYFESGSAYTYVVKDGVVSKVYIETGLYDSENIEVLSGVTADMQIITTWSSELRDGLEVEVVNE